MAVVNGIQWQERLPVDRPCKRGLAVTIRGKSILTLLLLSAIGIGAMIIGQKTKAWIQRRWPDLAEAPADDLRARQENAWTPPGHDCFPLTRGATHGMVMGRVEVVAWRAEGRLYFQVLGPKSPGDANHESDAAFCEAVYACGAAGKVEQFAADRAWILWQWRGQTVGCSAVPCARYRVHHEAGRVKLVFWTAEREPPESLRCRYRDEDQEGSISFLIPPPCTMDQRS
jgi:hypothetical protein